MKRNKRRNDCSQGMDNGKVKRGRMERMGGRGGDGKGMLARVLRPNRYH